MNADSPRRKMNIEEQNNNKNEEEKINIQNEKNYKEEENDISAAFDNSSAFSNNTNNNCKEVGEEKTEEADTDSDEYDEEEKEKNKETYTKELHSRLEKKRKDEKTSILQEYSKHSSSNLVGKSKLNVFKLNGWGYKDTYFKVIRRGGSNGGGGEGIGGDDTDDGGESRGEVVGVTLVGTRYEVSGRVISRVVNFVSLFEGLTFTGFSPPQKIIRIPEIKTYNEHFVKEIKRKIKNVCLSFNAEERLFHSHGHTCQEIFTLRYGKFNRIVDAVVYPTCTYEVEVIVKTAEESNVVLIPYGGGTCVSMALLCPPNENRMIVSVNMSGMNRLQWVDRESMLVCVDAGCVGKYLEQELEKYQLTLGHEPDSFEFSTLGGWISTRASGMKKNTYGNIEDMLVSITVVTCRGVCTRYIHTPRVSSGPEINHMFLGSEGTLGIITQAVLKVKPLPQVRRFGCIVFPDFESGVSFMREITRKNLLPTSVRLMDNFQFRFGLSFKFDETEEEKEKKGYVKTKYADILEAIKNYYLFNIAKFNINEMTGCTLLFEGEKKYVHFLEKNVYECAKKFKGLPAGSKNGQLGYTMTHLIAYIRDFVTCYRWLFESFETSVPWANIHLCILNVKKQIFNDCKKYGVEGSPLVMVRMSQVYDSGAVLYFYFGFKWTGLKNPLHIYNTVEENARDAIMQSGGSISHHHGVGKLRKMFMQKQVGTVGLNILRDLKSQLDPKNIFGSSNLF